MAIGTTLSTNNFSAMQASKSPTATKGPKHSDTTSVSVPVQGDSVSIGSPTPAAGASEASSTKVASGHGASCPCCQSKAGESSATKALAGAPMGIPGAYLQLKDGLKQQIENLPVKPEEITDVLYHDQCFDGFGARFAAQSARGSSVRYHAVNYKDAPPQLPPDAKVAIVDFSYPKEQLLDLQSKVAGLVVLDHHEKARQQLEGLPNAVFDMERAGSGLAWTYFHPNQEEPELLKYIEDRDLWKWELPQSREVSAAIGSLPMDYEVWKNANVETLKTEGVAILRAKQQLVDGAVKRAFWGDIDGHHVPITSCSPELRSEVGEGLKQKYPEAPFVGIFYYNEKGEKEWSLRSDDKFDVNEVAKKFGGGGHKAAAGLRDPKPAEAVNLVPPQPKA